MNPTKYRLVPCEPTEAMVAALENNIGSDIVHAGRGGHVFGATCARNRLTQSISAAPKASEDEALVERVALCLWENTKDDFGEFNGLPGDWKDEARAVLKMLEGE